MVLKTVRLYTDGLRDLVEIPGDCTYALIRKSIRQFLEAAAVASPLDEVIKQFESDGSVLVPVDLDRVRELFTPQPARRLAKSSIFTPHREVIGPNDMVGALMDDKTGIAELYGLTQKMAARLNAGHSTEDLTEEFRGIFAKINFPDFGDQSKNKAHYVKPKAPDTVEEGQKLPKEITHPKTASSDILELNQKIAEEILEKSEEIAQGIASMEEDRAFNAAAARLDLHGVISKVGYLAENANMAEAWVSQELEGLSKTAGQMHKYFKRAARSAE